MLVESIAYILRSGGYNVGPCHNSSQHWLIAPQSRIQICEDFTECIKDGRVFCGPVIDCAVVGVGEVSP